MFRNAALALVFVGWLAVPSFAQAPSETSVIAVPAPPEVRRDPHFTVSIEPIFLIASIFEANVEVRVAPHVALQALAGYGGFVFARIGELGGEANIYVRPEITGLHFGAELKYLWGSSSLPFSNDQSMDAVEREIALYAGWKWVGWRGLTAVVQGGIAQLNMSGGSPDSGIPKNQIVPAANTTLGLSF